MAALRSLLAVYGALDAAIIQTQDPVVAATVDAFLPMASANSGWYSAIETFFFGDDARPEPDLNLARTELETELAAGNSLTTPQKSRLFFAISALARLRLVAGPAAVPSVSDDDDYYSLLATALAAVAPTTNSSEPSSPTEAEISIAALKGANFLRAYENVVPYRFPDRKSTRLNSSHRR